MRININVVENAALSISSSSKVDLSAMPAPLIRLAPSGELVLIELQGSLEIDDAHADGGQILAKLEFNPGLEDRPTLLVSHHRLEGKIVNLPKPFAVLEKKKRSEKQQHKNNSFKKAPSSPNVYSQRQKANEKEEEEEEEDMDKQELPLASPTLSRKRARIEQHDDGNHRTAHVPSSSPLPPPRMQGSEMDYSSPIAASKQAHSLLTLPNKQATSEQAAGDNDEEHEDESDEQLIKRDTSTYFDVVCIIRKKILFAKRPEPVVRLDQEGGEQAKLALGLV